MPATMKKPAEPAPLSDAALDAHLDNLKSNAMGEFVAAIVLFLRGIPLDLTGLQDMLIRCGKSSSDFKAQVARLRPRRDALTSLEGALARKRTVPKLQQAAAAAAEEYQRVRLASAKAVDEALIAMQVAQSAARGAAEQAYEDERDAMRILRGTVRPGAIRRLDEIDQERLEIAHRLAPIQTPADWLQIRRDWIDQRDRLPRTDVDGQTAADQHIAQGEADQALRAELEQRLTALAQERDSLEAEIVAPEYFYVDFE